MLGFGFLDSDVSPRNAPHPSSEISTTYAEVGGILDYAAEAKDGELPETVKPIDEEDGDFLVFRAVVGSEIRQTHQLRLVVYPIIYRVLYILGGCL